MAGSTLQVRNIMVVNADIVSVHNHIQPKGIQESLSRELFHGMISAG